MAYYDRAAAKYKEECREAFQKLKRRLSKGNPKAYDHIADLERELISNREELGKHHELRKALKDFIG